MRSHYRNSHPFPMQLLPPRSWEAFSGSRPSERESVFERFYRAGDELTRQAPGLGLGLYLVRRTVEELGGRVRLEAGAAGGARVTVLLPLETAAVTQRRAAQAGV